MKTSTLKKSTLKKLSFTLILLLAIVSIGLVWFINHNTPKLPTNTTQSKISTNPNATLDKLVLAGPFASVSNPMVRLVESGALNDIAKEVELRYWADPNQMRAMVLKGDVDFIAMPTNVAASMYNKGVDLKLLNVSIWGILYIVSNDENLASLNQLQGKALVVPFRGDMPDIVLKTLLKNAGLDAEKDVKLHYVANPLAAMKMMMTHRADQALLVEPAVSMALTKTQTLPIKVVAPELYRNINLQQVWGEQLGRQPRIPQAGIAVVNPKLSDATVNRFMQAYAKATDWVNANPEAAGELIAQHVTMLTPKAISESIAHTGLHALDAQTAKPELEFFYQQLAAVDGKLIGNKLPDAGFYYAPTTVHHAHSAVKPNIDTEKNGNN